LSSSRVAGSTGTAKSGLAKTMLLTGTLPQPNGVGGIILSDLCTFLPKGALCVAHVPEGKTSHRDAMLAGQVPLRTFSVAYQHRPSSQFGRFGRAIQWLAQFARNRGRLNRQIAACVEWARMEDIRQVWAVLDSPVSLLMAEPVAAALGVPLLITIWDDIHHNTRYFGVDRFSAKRLAVKFGYTLRQCVACAVIGETMKAEYEQLYGVRAVIVRHGLPPEASIRGVEERGHQSGIVIGFAGSVTAASAFQAMLSTLDRLDWSLDGRPITLRLMGHRFDLRSQVRRRIECYGWRSVDETLTLLSSCDFNYLPQPFEQEWSPFARLSFPTKLSTYLAAGVPLLLHSPTGASLPAFIARYPFGTWCSTLDSTSIEQSMRLLLDSRFAQECTLAGREALDAEFTRSTFRTQFAEFLGVDAGQLNT